MSIAKTVEYEIGKLKPKKVYLLTAAVILTDIFKVLFCGRSFHNETVKL